MTYLNLNIEYLILCEKLKFDHIENSLSKYNPKK
jgi:hypothetical protein